MKNSLKYKNSKGQIITCPTNCNLKNKFQDKTIIKIKNFIKHKKQGKYYKNQVFSLFFSIITILHYRNLSKDIQKSR